MDITVGKVPGAGGELARAAASEIEKCVHCGFCTAACPTYVLDRNELDSPRGRIYLVKRMLEDGSNAQAAQLHLDRCLTCRSCEPACPSGVGYSRIAHAGRDIAASLSPQGIPRRAGRFALLESARSRIACRIARGAVRAAGPLAPRRLRRALAKSPASDVRPPVPRHGRKVAVLAGCAQAGLMPESNSSLAALLDLAGYDAEFLKAPCCGALRMHGGRRKAALADVRRTVREAKAALDVGAEAVLVAASGCGSFAKEYPSVLSEDDPLAADARAVAARTEDPASFLLGRLDADALGGTGEGRKVAAHVPCTLRNGLRSPGAFAEILRRAGFDVVEPENPPNCCGSAGTYSVFQPELAGRLADRTRRSVEATAAAELVTANIGCALHMRRALRMPVNHWLDVAAAAAAGGGAGAADARV